MLSIPLAAVLSKTSQNGSYGIGISGDVGLNSTSDTTLAYIHDAVVTSTGADLNINAVNDTDLTALSGGAAILTKNGGSLGLAGSYAQNTLGGLTSAFVDNSKLGLSGNLSLDAATRETIVSISASGSVATSNSGISLDGQASINTVDTSTGADIDDQSMVSASSVAVTANDTDTIFAIAGALSYGGKAGFGASFSDNTISPPGQKPLATAFIANSAVTTTSGTIQIIAQGDESVEAITAALAAGLQGMAGALSTSLNTISPANIIASVSGSTLIAAGALSRLRERQRGHRGPLGRAERVRGKTRFWRRRGHQ